MAFSVSFRNRLEKEIKIQLGNFRSVFLKSLDSKLSESLLEVGLAAVLEVPLVARFGRGRFRLENLRFVFRTGRISLGWLLQRAAVVAEQLNSASFGNPPVQNRSNPRAAAANRRYKQPGRVVSCSQQLLRNQHQHPISARTSHCWRTGGARFERLSRGLSCPAEDRTLTGVFTKPVRCYCLSFSSFSVKRFE